MTDRNEKKPYISEEDLKKDITTKIIDLTKFNGIKVNADRQSIAAQTKITEVQGGVNTSLAMLQMIIGEEDTKAFVTKALNSKPEDKPKENKDEKTDG